jgi:DNA-binding NarL/FixJ family response regulator
MAITVLLADDAEIVRNAIRSLLLNNSQIVELVGEAVDFPQTVQMANHLKPQVVVMDLHMARAAEASDVKGSLREYKMLAISLSNDDETKQLADSYGAMVLLDKMELYDELVSTIVKVAFPTNIPTTA